MATRIPVWVIAAVALTSVFGASAADGILVDEVVAVVNRQVIAYSEIVREGELILAEREGERGQTRRLTADFLNQVRELLINQRVLLDEALRMGLPLVTGREVERLLRGFRQHFSSEEVYMRFLFEHDLTEEDVGDTLAHHLRVERLKEKKLRSMPEVDDEAVRRYYDRHKIELGGNPLKIVAEAIRLKLITETRDKALSRWVWELRKRSEVKILVDLASDAADGD
ncbi:MAG TPA: SurA N-terminal domain-containing protein [Myxococcota bacterium]|nr:SurA N-terminal domain-containing protein [Myxococcota bacterium]